MFYRKVRMNSKLSSNLRRIYSRHMNMLYEYLVNAVCLHMSKLAQNMQIFRWKQTSCKRFNVMYILDERLVTIVTNVFRKTYLVILCQLHPSNPCTVLEFFSWVTLVSLTIIYHSSVSFLIGSRFLYFCSFLYLCHYCFLFIHPFSSLALCC